MKPISIQNATKMMLIGCIAVGGLWYIHSIRV